MHIQLILNKKLLNLDKNMNSAEIEVRKKFSNIPGNEIIFPIEDFIPFQLMMDEASYISFSCR